MAIADIVRVSFLAGQVLVEGNPTTHARQIARVFENGFEARPEQHAVRRH